MSLAIQPAGANFNDPSLPIIGDDRMLNGGSLALLDFANSKLYPAQDNSFLGLLNGVPNKGAILYNAPSGGAVTFAGGGMDFNNAILGGPGLRVGTQAATGVAPTYDLSTLAADTELLVILWRKRTAVAGASQQQIINLTAGGATGTGSQQLEVAEAVDGVRLTYAGQTVQTNAAPALDTVQQLAWHIKPNGTNPVAVTAYRNGVKVGVFSLPYQALVAFGAAGGFRIGTATLGMTGQVAPNGVRLYRVLLENISLSTRDPERQVARDYALNNGRFS